MYQMQFPTPSRNPQYYAAQLKSIAIEARKLETIEEMTWRDVAVAADLWQRYIDIMEEIENTVEVVGDESVVVGIGTVNLKLKSVGQIAEWINDGDKEP